ncbi:leucine-rich repeat domain-containing protein [Streptomyces cyaneofuscatus]
MAAVEELDVALGRIAACKQTGAEELDLSGLDLREIPQPLAELTQLTKLDLHENQIESIPEFMGNLTELFELNLGQNRIDSIPGSFGNLTHLRSLILTENKLSSIPECFGNLRGIQELSLGNNQLASISEVIGNLIHLTTLDLQNNRLETIPDCCGDLLGLRELTLSDNLLTSVPASLGNLTQLTELDLNENQLSSIPGTLRGLHNLTFLRLDINRFKSVPAFISSLTNLTRLDLDNNQISSVPETLGELAKLSVLYLYSNQLTTIPDSLGDLAELNILHLGNNSITSIPEAVGNLTNLTELHLNDNELTSVPEILGNLKKLTHLDLGSNHLTSVPDILSEFSSLRRLVLHENQLAFLPDTLGGLSSLRYLDVSNNHLTDVPECISELTQLLQLALAGNQLTSIPDTLGNLTLLNLLTLNNNHLRSVPSSLGNLTDLKELYLNNNQLISVPDDFGNLSGLRMLQLHRNQLTSLPETLGNLTELILLRLNDNQLTSLPVTLGRLTQLDILHLKGNQLTSPPPEVISAGAQAVVSFLGEMTRDAVRQWASKIVVVGEGRVGKTSLLRALRREAHNPQEESTHGLTVDDLSLPHPSPPENEDVIMRLSTWDFGGQEIYHATHQFFLTDRSLFLLLWDAQIGWEGSKLHYWLDMIKARAPQAPVVLVATHLGPRPPDLPLTELMETYPGLIVASLAADSQSREGIAEVRECIRQQAAQLPLMGATWPRRWLRAADAVRAAETKHVEPESLYSLMAGEGVTEEGHQHALTAALHSLGDLLFYPDDEELCDLVILRPQWLTEYISRVLDSETVLDNGGLFQHNFGSEIWPDVGRAMRRHFIRMMENFDLSYQTEDRMGSLVVELLPWNPPPYQQRWDALLSDGQRELRLRYKLHTVPPGIPTWFIAREHRFSTGLRWRSGALLNHPDGEHFGLVIVDRHAKTAEIRVRGPYPHDFFAVLKDGFEQTLQRYPGLDISRSVPCPHKDENGNPCSHEFSHTQLLARISRKQPREIIECPEHLDDLDVRTLLQGIEPPTAHRSEALAVEALAKLNQLELGSRQNQTELRSQFTQLTASFAEELGRTRAEVSAVFAEQQRAFLAELRREQSRNEVVCPSLVWVRRISRRRIAGIVSGDVFQLHLCCEAPGEWHLLPEVEPYELPAVSQITQSVVLPYLQRTLSVLKYVVPIFGAGLGMASDDMAKALKDDIDLMKSLIDGLPSEMRVRMSEGQVNSMVRAENHAAYRQMHHLLKQLDPSEVWGGLNKTTTPEGHTYWLCSDHARIYRPSVPEIGGTPLPPLS